MAMYVEADKLMNKCVIKEGKLCALEIKACYGCKFFKTKEQQKASRAKARERLNSLPLELQIYILQKYYPKQKIPKITEGAEKRDLFKHIK